MRRATRARGVVGALIPGEKSGVVGRGVANTSSPVSDTLIDSVDDLDDGGRGRGTKGVLVSKLGGFKGERVARYTSESNERRD